MSYDIFTVALNVADFPFISDFFNRSVILPGIDQPPKVPRSVTSTENANPELAQHYFGQNIMPTKEGIMSVGYKQIVPAYTPPATDFDQIITLRDEDENNFLLAPARGINYIYREDAAVWDPKDSFVGWTGELVSRAYVNGRTFVCYQRHSIREYNSTADTFLPVAFTGKSPSTIDCIGASSNYLLWADGITIGWSSLIDPTDLVPSINTGAGSAVPQDMKGPARAIVAIAGGFIIYTTKNAVAALYTNNARAPFVFREVANAGGAQFPERISQDSTDVHYGWTTNGLQEIKITGGKPIDAGASDFLAGRIYESFDIPSLTWTVKRINSDLQVKVTFIAGRFLVISYGEVSTPQIYTHALVQDTALKRWGKLRIDHVDCFAYPYPNLIGLVTETPSKLTVAFLQKDGTVQLLLQDYRDGNNEGVLLLGKFQLVRQKMITYQSFEIESLQQGYPPSVYLLLSADGRNNAAPVALQVLSDSGNRKKYGGPLYSGTGAAPARTGLNFSTLMVGRIELSAAIATVTRHGNR